MIAHPDQTVYLPMTRSMRLRIEATIEQLIGLLDEVDGDPGCESGTDAESDGEELEDDARDLPA